MLSYIDVIPTKECISRGEPLNLLGGVANDGEAVLLDISVWGRVAEEWESLSTQRVAIEKNEHKHLYFTLEPACFSMGRWGEEIDEIELLIRDQRPGRGESGRIIFLD